MNVTALVPNENDTEFLAGDGEMAELIRQRDWSKTPLGPISTWPQSLRTTASLCLASNFPINIIWGPAHTQIYNDGYRIVCGEVHPRALGEDYCVTWASAWPAIGQPFESALAGDTSYLENQRMFLTRNGYLEETFFTFSLSPIRDESGGIGGLFHPVTETTATMLAERRTRALRCVGASLTEATDETELAARICGALSQFEFDIPFVLLYRFESDAYVLKHRHGVAESVTSIRERVSPEETAAWPIARATNAEKVVAVEGLRATLRDWSAGPYEEPPNRAMLLHIDVPGVERAPMVIVAGVSPRLPWNEAYHSFYDLLLVTIASGLASVRAREDERRRAHALAEIDRAKTAFFSNVSHEFRTPLTLMLGPLEEVLASPAIPKQEREQLGLAHRNSLRLLKLVNSLLDFSRIEAGRVQASYEPTDLPALTRDIASTFRSAIERAGLNFTVSCDELNSPVHIDREMWEKIVLNLLSNAFKFTLTGKIELRLYRYDDEVIFEIADTGVGVAKAEIPRLFERFHRIEGVEGRTQEGSGIGLALVQELVKLHGGTITVYSEHGVGTTFSIRLHFGAAHLPVERVKVPHALSATSIGSQAFVQEALRWLPPAGTASTSRMSALLEPSSSYDRRFASTAGARIILADDNADMRGYVRALLDPYYAVEIVGDGAEALAAAHREMPDLILTDVMMPKMDGFALLAAVRRNELLRNVPVVILSARAGEEARVEGLDAGADDYLIKPFSGRELLARIGALLELRQMRRRAEAAFRRRTEQFETLLAAAPMGVYLVDSEFLIREMNPTALLMFRDIPNLIGRSFEEVIHIRWAHEYAEEIVAKFRHTLETGEALGREEFIQRRLTSGETDFYEWQINRIALPEGGYGVVCYFRDIRVQVESERALVAQREALEGVDRQKDEFLAMLAHELRNPLAPIRNAAELLSRMPSAHPSAATAVSIVKRQVAHLTRLVDDLLDVSRITQGRVELQRQVVALADVILQALEVVDPLMRERKHAVSITSTDGPFYVDGDAARLIQCMSNLLTNSAKYTDSGGHVYVDSRGEGLEVIVRVRDNGAGIPQELLPRVFDLFVQSGRTLDRAQGGLGIGLSVVRELVRLHGGAVSATSDGPGTGSTFEIRLPLAALVAEPVTQNVREGRPARRILVVDDNEDSATSLAMVLQLDGHTVLSVVSSERALREIAAFKPDVVLLDLGLPQIDGFEVARRIRKMHNLEKVRIVALTGYGQLNDRERTVAAGFDNHLVKPVRFDDLERAIS